MCVFLRVRGEGFRAWGLGFRVEGLRFRVWGLGFRGYSLNSLKGLYEGDYTREYYRGY